MEVLCAYGMRSRIWKESKFGMIGYVKFVSCTRGFPKFFDLCFTGFRRSNWQHSGGQTGGKAAVRPAGDLRSDRRRQLELAIDLGGSTSVTTLVRPTISRRSDRCIYFGQTAIRRFRGDSALRGVVRRGHAEVLVGTGHDEVWCSIRWHRSREVAMAIHAPMRRCGEISGVIHAAMRRWGETSGNLTPSMVKSTAPSLILNR
ncbi:hypothetical protein [Oryza sativa Japonica Group]|uniref:Uncharacterized protein n=1 Tax=Oryza sativa subsp. japonica TaxID=39947 RepID=Q5ZDG4_ORYSJ|nr:hypothetical protein [Oryza sativa Japonica Group]